MNYYYAIKSYVELICEGIIGVSVVSCIKIKTPEIKEFIIKILQNKRNF